MKEESHKKAIAAISSLSRIYYSMNNKFLTDKINQKIFSIARVYIDLNKNIEGAGNNNVAQYFRAERLDLLLDQTLEILEIIPLVKNLEVSPIIRLSAIKKILDFKLGIKKEFLNQNKEKTENIPKIGTKIRETEKSSVEFKKEKPQIQDYYINKNKRKILEFIKNNPDSRSKEIIKNFSDMSGRTVKRNLSELLTDGLIRKKSDSGGSIKYF